jgi:Predicted integral membrane protein (DUF2282)
MKRRTFVGAALSTAVGLAIAMQAVPLHAQGNKGMQGMKDMPQVVKDNMERAQAQHLEKCYGINAVARNDCAEGAHSCAGQATRARDTQSFVLLPAGDCSKIAGGKLKSS